MLIRRLVSSDAKPYQTLRLAALREYPSAFCSSYEEECDTPLATIAGHMAPGSGRNRFGAFDGDELVGMLGVGRDNSPKLRHKAFIRGVYVAPSHRGTGLGRQLMEQALVFAASMEGVHQIGLVVTASNVAAVTLYQTLGFESFGLEQRALLVDGVFYDDLYMVRNIAPPHPHS